MEIKNKRYDTERSPSESSNLEKEGELVIPMSLKMRKDLNQYSTECQSRFRTFSQQLLTLQNMSIAS